MKHQPQRACIGCGARKAQHELLRLAARNGEFPMRDRTGSTPGRGAYLCAQAECVEKAWKRRSVERSLKLKAAAPPVLKDELLDELRIKD